MHNYIIVECLDYKGNNTCGEETDTQLIPIYPITHTWYNKKEK